jgi:hypothetical protein
MATSYLARRSLWFLLVSLSLLVCLVAVMPAGAERTGARLADFKSRAQPGRFTLFESGQVRPLALSPTGKFLFAANTPDNRLEVFRIESHGLEHRASIPVGLEPVAVAARNDNEVWVVNHLSDSVSVVDLTQGANGGRGRHDPRGRGEDAATSCSSVSGLSHLEPSRRKLPRDPIVGELLFFSPASDGCEGNGGPAKLPDLRALRVGLYARISRARVGCSHV